MNSSYCPFTSTLVPPLSGKARNPGSIICPDEEANEPGTTFESGDEIRMVLDTKQRTLVYYIDNSKCKTWFQNIEFDGDTIYNMVVLFSNGEYELSLLNF